ncbi:MAG: helix-turn-helix transcriptional regulator [Planctomycetota bacterium]|nr:helix-turn-helix transcriptional regulator [Planctomycetota bacterium]
MRVERELMRGAGPLAVLKLLENGEKYGYQLVESLAKQSDGVLAMGQSTLYPMLYNLEAKGLIRATWRESDSKRKRKYYCLTDRGHKKLIKDTQQWEALTAAMISLGVIAPSASVREALT